MLDHDTKSQKLATVRSNPLMRLKRLLCIYLRGSRVVPESLHADGAVRIRSS
jgi:hypothetical protein